MCGHYLVLHFMHFVLDDVKLQSVEFNNLTFSFLNYTGSISFERSQLYMHAFLTLSLHTRKHLNGWVCFGRSM